MKKTILLVLSIMAYMFLSCDRRFYNEQVIPKSEIELDIMNVNCVFDTNTIKINEQGYFTIKATPKDSLPNSVLYHKNRTYTIDYLKTEDILMLVDESKLEIEVNPTSKVYNFDSSYTFKYYPKNVGKKTIRISFFSNGKTMIKNYVLYVHNLDTKVNLDWVSKYANQIDNNNGDYILKDLKNFNLTQGDDFVFNRYMMQDTSDISTNYLYLYRNGDKVVKHITWAMFQTEDMNETYKFYYRLDNRLRGQKYLKLANSRDQDINGMDLPVMYIYEPNYTNGFTFDILTDLNHPSTWIQVDDNTGICYSHLESEPLKIFIDIKNSKDEIVFQDTLTYTMNRRDCLYNNKQAWEGTGYSMIPNSTKDEYYDTNGKRTPFGSLCFRKLWIWNPNHKPNDFIYYDFEN